MLNYHPEPLLVSSRPIRNSCKTPCLLIHHLFVQLLGLSQTLLLGSLRGDLAVVVRRSGARSGDVGSNLLLDGVEDAALVLLDGL